MKATSRKPLLFSRSPNLPLTPLRVRSLHDRMHRPADQKLVERVRREFCDLRGLSPTMPQVRRLFHLADEECREVLAQLLREDFLDLGDDARYRLRKD